VTIGSSPPARGTGLRLRLRRHGRRFIPACAGNGRTPSRSKAFGPVHPRLRGERWTCPAQCGARRGSSPPARGTGVLEQEVVVVLRFIPACAGSGRRGPECPFWRAVHPRLRGERTLASTLTPSQAGSSPPARGTGSQKEFEMRALRFIPACAGNGSWTPRARTATPVHPRLRGERQRHPMKTATVNGSSPPARGTGDRVAPRAALTRFIPACAGNGRAAASPARRRSVHPRLRGERTGTVGSDSSSSGSSPPARGTGARAPQGPVAARFIPACAGNGTRRRCLPHTRSVHPRLRGERPAIDTGSGSSHGSSPPARGTGRFCLARLRPCRFIPACAGNGSWWLNPTCATSVHPRLRGERRRRSVRARCPCGSSPPARGTGARARRLERLERFIPACAGNGSWGRR
jgi:hypothetical protein